MPGARTENSRTTANPDGTVSTEISAGRLNYPDPASGNWLPLDLHLLREPAGAYDLRVTANDRSVRFGADSADEALGQVGTDQATVGVRALDFPSSLTEAPPEVTPSASPTVNPSAGPSIPPTASPIPPTASPSSPSSQPTPSASATASVGPSAPGPTPVPSPAPSDLAPSAPAASTAPAPSPTQGASPSPNPAASIAPSPSPTVEPSPSPTPGPSATLRPQALGDESLVFTKDDSTGRIFAQPTDLGFEFGVILDNPAQANRYTFAVATGGLEPSIGLDGLSIVLSRAGTDRTEATVVEGGLSSPVALDALGAIAPSGAIGVELYRPGIDTIPPNGVSAAAVASLRPDEVIVSYTLDPLWLADPARSYPVVIDPTTCLGAGASTCDGNLTGGHFDHFIESGTPNSVASGSNVRVGYDNLADGVTYNKMRGLFYFKDVANFVDGTQITKAELKLKIATREGSPNGNNMYAYRATTPWGTSTTWNQFTNTDASTGYTTTGQSVLAVPTILTMNWDTTDIVRAWYTRRGVDWSSDLGFVVKMGSEISANDAVDFHRSTAATASDRPLLMLTYVKPRVQMDFAPELGATYAPTTMVLGQTAKLPITVLNNGSGFTYPQCPSPLDALSDCYRIGYRWFDEKGKVADSGNAWGDQDLAAGLTSTGSTGTFPLSVSPPPISGQYTLRLDLVHRLGTTDKLWASDWATPSRFYSRDKRVLTSDSTRWTGSSLIEREEFPISVVPGSGTSVGDLQSVGTGDGGSLGLNLYSKNLHYDGQGGVAVSDLVPLTLSYGYDSKNGTDCSGVLKACGWYTNYDERVSAAASGNDYTYQGPSGTRYQVGTDGQGQLSSGAPGLLERSRMTPFDENTFPDTDFATVQASSESPSFPAYSGSYVTKTPSNVSSTVGTITPIDINTYRYLSFAVHATTTITGTSLGFKVHNVDQGGTDTWLNYVIGTHFNPGGTAVEYLPNGQTGSSAGTLTSTSAMYHFDVQNIYQDVRNNGFGSTYDHFQVVGIQLISNGQTGGQVYLDSIHFEPGESAYIADANRSWTANGSAASLDSSDAYVGSNSIKVNAASYGLSPLCDTTASDCFGATGGGLYAYPFASWAWKKVGGTSVAIEIMLKDLRPDSGGAGVYKTGSITYYAGPVPPVGAPNPVQVSDTVPLDWTPVTRNLLEDGRQVLNFFNDQPYGTDPGAPPSQGPTPDDVRWIGFRLLAGDGNFARFDQLRYGSMLTLGGVNDLGTEDFTATFPSGETHYFNNVGLLARIVDRNSPANVATLTYDRPAGSLTLTDQAGFRLTKIAGPSDGTTSGSWTYDRRIDLSRSGDDTTFTENVGGTGDATAGRSTTFTVASTAGTFVGVGDLTKVDPARHHATCAGTRPSGCAEFDYTDATLHRLSHAIDPRWDGSTSGADDARFEIDWSTIANTPSAILDRSHASAAQLKVVSWDDNEDTTPLYLRPLWQSASAAAAGAAIHTDFTSDGATLYRYVPQACSGNCPANAVGTTSGLSGLKASASEFDGLARVTKTTTYRTASADPSVTRQGGKAAAKVDNYIDPLTASEPAWSQTGDQYFASLKDSANTDPDLYRTTFGYNGYGRPVSTTAPAFNPRADYVATTKNLVPTTTNLIGYWRLGEASGSTAANATGGAVGAYSAGFAGGDYGQPGALVGDADKAAVFDGVDNVVTIGSLGTVSGSYTVAAWIKPTSTTSTVAFVGSRKSTTGSTDFTFDAKLNGQNLRVDIGDGTVWLASAVDIPFSYVANRWYDVAVAVDDLTDSYTVYVNGVPFGRKAFTTAGTPRLADATRVLRWGNNGRDSTTPEWFTGSIDEASAWTESLSAGQVSDLYLAGRSMVAHTAYNGFDAAWHPIQTNDQFLASGGFESGISDWEASGGAAAYFTAGSNIRTGSGSLSVPTGGTAIQDVAVLPGQTLRIQGYNKSGTATYRVQSWQRSGSGGWVDRLTGTTAFSDASFAGHAWDVTLPFDTDGRVRITLGNTSATTAYFDDVALFTTFGATTYQANGLVSGSHTIALASNPTQPEIVLTPVYAATSAHPAIFTTSSIANDVASVTDPLTEDVTSSTTYDTYGHALTTTDPDGIVAGPATYQTGTNGYLTDVVSTANAFGNTTNFGYDLVGNKLTTQTPTGLTTTAVYDVLNHPVRVTGPDGILNTTVYDNYGQATSTIANYVDGSPSGAGGIDDLTTSSTYDAFGRVTAVIGNTGYSGAISPKSTTTYDLLGNALTSTTYATHDGSTYGGARTTTASFETANGLSRTAPTGTVSPLGAPSGAPAPDCPDGSGKCSTVSSVDFDGATYAVTDTYGKIARTFSDLSGRAVFTIANYADGTFTNASPTDDLVSITQYDLLGRVHRVVGVPKDDTSLGLAAVTDFDALGRAIKVTSYNTAGTAVSDSKTVYTKGGRTDRISSTEDPAATDSQRTWTRTAYDKAGRAVRTLAHVDLGTGARITTDGFEDGRSGASMLASGDERIWTSGTAGVYTSSGGSSTAQLGAGLANSGEGRLAITTGTGTNTGSELALSGTFAKTPTSHTYKAVVFVNAPVGTTINGYLGTAADAGSTQTVVGDGTYQRMTLSWTPTADRSSGVVLALRRNAAASAATFYLDDAIVWDDTTAADQAWNIPSETALDADGRTIASVVVPGDPATEHPLVTRTAYDPTTGRLSSVVVDDIAGVSGGSTQTTFTSSADAHVKSANTTNNYGTLTTLQVRADAATPNDYKPFLKFVVSGLSGSVTNVKLRLNNTATSNSSSRDVCVYPVTDTSWTETGITWATAPSVGSSLVCVHGNQATGWIDYDLGTPLSGNGTVAFAVFQTTSTSVIYSSKEGANAPQLVVTTSGAPTDPSVSLTTTNHYDGLGRVDTVTDPAGNVTQTTYDRLGRAVATIQNYKDGTPSNNSIASGSNLDDDVKSTFAYNALGELVAYCPANAVAGADACDPTSTTTTSNAYKSAWHYTLDNVGRVTVQVPPVKTAASLTQLSTKVWTYDTGTRLTKNCDAAAGATDCSSATRNTVPHYDAVGRVDRLQTFSGSGSTTDTAYRETATTYRPDSLVNDVKSLEGTSATPVDSITSAYDTLNRPASLTRNPSSTALSSITYNADGTLASRSDGDGNAIGTSTFSYDWAKRQTGVHTPSGWATTDPSFTYRLDGLIGSRKWNGDTNAAVFSFDAAKRPTGIAKGSIMTFAQAYDRNGNVTSESRTTTGVSGDAGTGTQTFTYDGLNRVIGASGMAITKTYEYDLDSNRTKRVEGGTTFDATFDRTDQPINVLKTSGTTQSFSFDAYGNLTGNAETAAAVSTMTYDLADRLAGIDPAGSTNDTTFTFDALGRIRTRLVNGTTDTYSYLGGSESVVRIATGGTNTDSLSDGAGTRLGVKVGSTVNWFLPDLHGNIASSLDVTGATVTNAVRYDAYGMTLASGGSGSVGAANWLYQGRLDVSPAGLGTPLYEAGARMYSPGLATFTSLDSVRGSAQDPISLNRYLYAAANPATLIDPSGHQYCGPDGTYCGQTSVDKQSKQIDSIGHRNGRVIYTYYQPSGARKPKPKDTPPAQKDDDGYVVAAVAAKGTSVYCFRGGCNRVSTSATSPESNPLTGVARGLWNFTGGFAADVVSNGATILTHLDLMPAVAGLTGDEIRDAVGNSAAMGGDIATHIDQVPTRVNNLAYDMRKNWDNGLAVFGAMSPADQGEFIADIVLTGGTLARGIASAPDALNSIRGLKSALRAGDSAAVVTESTVQEVSGPYVRPSGATTAAQRAAVQGQACVTCGATAPTMAADHILPLVQEWYQSGGIDLARMRSVEAVQPQCMGCSNAQGGTLSWYSRLMRETYFGPR